MNLFHTDVNGAHILFHYDLVIVRRQFFSHLDAESKPFNSFQN